MTLCALAAAWCLPAVAEAQRPARAYALLASGRVVAVSTGTGAVLATRRIGPGPPIAIATPMLARRDDVLYALTPRRGGQTLVLLDTADLRVRERITLPAKIEFSAVVVTRAGVAHLLGTRGGAPLRMTLTDGVLSAPTEIRPAAGRDWLVISATLSSDDRRLAVSYHGGRTTGADIVDLTTGQREPCGPRNPATGCFAYVHGAAAFAGDDLVGTSGSTELAIYSRDGRPRRIETELPRNHLMALARDPSTGAVVTAVTCWVANAVSIVDVATGSARVYRNACGDVVAADNGLAVVGAADGTLRRRVRTGLSFLQIASGRRLRSSAPPHRSRSRSDPHVGSGGRRHRQDRQHEVARHRTRPRIVDHGFRRASAEAPAAALGRRTADRGAPDDEGEGDERHGADQPARADLPADQEPQAEPDLGRRQRASDHALQNGGPAGEPRDAVSRRAGDRSFCTPANSHTHAIAIRSTSAIASRSGSCGMAWATERQHVGVQPTRPMTNPSQAYRAPQPPQAAATASPHGRPPKNAATKRRMGATTVTIQNRMQCIVLIRLHAVTAEQKKTHRANSNSPMTPIAAPMIQTTGTAMHTPMITTNAPTKSRMIDSTSRIPQDGDVVGGTGTQAPVAGSRV